MLKSLPKVNWLVNINSGGSGSDAAYLIVFSIAYLIILYYITRITITGGANSNTRFLSVLYVVILIVPFVYFYKKLGFNFSEITSITPKTILFFVLFLAALYGIIYVIGNALGAGSVILTGASIVIGLAIVYNFFKDSGAGGAGEEGEPSKSPIINWMKFLWKFIFYIPCLVIDLVNYINAELKITPGTTWSLFVIEIFILILLYYYPAFVKNIIVQDGKLIVNEPLYLNRLQVVGKVSDIIPKNDIQTGAFPAEKKQLPIDAALNYSDAQYYQQRLVQDYCAKNPTDPYCSNLDITNLTDSSFVKILGMRDAGTATDYSQNKTTVKCTDVFEKSGAGYFSIGDCLLDDYDTTYLPLYKTKIKQQMQNTYARNYSVAMWIFMNQQTPTAPGYSRPTNIFRIGKYSDPGIITANRPSITQGKPMISYFIDNDPATGTSMGKYRFFLTDDTSPPAPDDKPASNYDLRAPEQKWNLFVINFSDSVDIFLNGDLVITKQINTTVPNDTDYFVVGEKDGLDGALCSLVWFPYPLTQNQIKNYYNSLKGLNPPVIDIKK
jgi:hypothetical protein